ncbi:MAG: PfkB family carbohydrate kinase, partial [Solirubrobacterales bacterium]
VCGPVSSPREFRGAAERLRERGARSVVVTRGADPALVLHEDEAWELAPPRFDGGTREGCGDSMMGAIAAARAAGRPLEEALVIGAAAGAVNFLHHGLGTGTRREVEEMVGQVELRRA